MHEQALDELNYVIENRSALPDSLTKSNYFTFVLREMSQTQFESMRKRQETAKVQQTNQKLPTVA